MNNILVQGDHDSSITLENIESNPFFKDDENDLIKEVLKGLLLIKDNEDRMSYSIFRSNTWYQDELEVWIRNNSKDRRYLIRYLKEEDSLTVFDENEVYEVYQPIIVSIGEVNNRDKEDILSLLIKKI